ncbi:Whirlin [Portunus trituberculatus]|uniref:Whirlin n=1 Tax=Portunus trituberculatus TaxID=210409 RepID=A0A5B7IHB3_PORTR|nr:Whirlin [Portunus trituberculatus]
MHQRNKNGKNSEKANLRKKIEVESRRNCLYNSLNPLPCVPSSLSNHLILPHHTYYQPSNQPVSRSPQVGDQILEVNSESFLAVTHDTAVNILKYSRRLQLCVRRVGRIPHSCTTYDRRSWPPSAKKE